MGISLKGILGAVAPVIASALPGPLGNIARKALEGITGKPDASDKEIEKLLASADPATLLKLKQLDADFSTKMKELNIDFEKLAAEDRASARAMQVSTKSKSPAVLAAAISLGWLAAFGLLIFKPLPEANSDAIMLALGTLNSALMAVVYFYYGSSSGSRSKDETIKALSA